MKQKKIGNLIYSIFLALCGAALLTVTIAGIIEYCAAAPADYAAWLGITTGVIAILTGLFVVILAGVGILRACKTRQWRVALVLSTLFMALSWLSLFFCPGLASLTYELTSPHVKMSAEQAEGWGADCVALLTDEAAARGDDILLYTSQTSKDGAPEQADYTRRYFADVTPAQTCDTFTLAFRYDAQWEKLTVSLEFDYRAPEGGEPDWTALDCPLHYLNMLTERTFTREEAVATLKGEDGAFNQAWDGVEYMRCFDDRQTIEARKSYSATDNQRFDDYVFTITAWPSADFAVKQAAAHLKAEHLKITAEI